MARVHTETNEISSLYSIYRDLCTFFSLDLVLTHIAKVANLKTNERKYFASDIKKTLREYEIDESN
jgi:hypothetical protein